VSQHRQVAAQRRFHLRLLVTQPLLLQRLLDGLAEPGETILQQVVGGALAHGGDGQFLTDAPRHDDEGNVEAALDEQGQRAVAVELRQAVIGTDEIGEAVERL